MVTAVLAAMVPLPEKRTPKCEISLSALNDLTVANRFATFVEDAMQQYAAADQVPCSLNLQYARITDAFHHAAQNVLPSRISRAQRSWISPMTLKLLDDRSLARSTVIFEWK